MQFKAMLVDNLNAEVVLGTVTNVREAATWLSYTWVHGSAACIWGEGWLVSS